MKFGALKCEKAAPKDGLSLELRWLDQGSARWVMALQCEQVNPPGPAGEGQLVELYAPLVASSCQNAERTCGLC